jgi:probable HAF family extracellular repeat protein
MVMLEPASEWTPSAATGANADGTVIVGYGAHAGVQHAFKWTAATGVVDLGAMPDDAASRALAVSADGRVVVGRSDRGTQRAAVWDPVRGVATVADVLGAAGVDTSGWSLTVADAVSADGRIEHPHSSRSE